MKHLLLAVALVLGFGSVLVVPTALAAQGEDETAIQGIISSQIDAFRAGEMEQAFGYASDGIRRLFVTPESFGAMVSGGYAMVIDPAEVRFLELRVLDGTLWQKVLMKDGAGVWHVLDYAMVEEAGGWRINGVQFLRRGEVGA